MLNNTPRKSKVSLETLIGSKQKQNMKELRDWLIPKGKPKLRWNMEEDSWLFDKLHVCKHSMTDNINNGNKN